MGSLIFIILSGNLLAITGDSSLSWISPMYLRLKSTDPNINPLGRPITRDEDGWLGSLVNIGAMVSPLLFGFICSKYGRRISLLTISVPALAAYVILAFAGDINSYYVARLLQGLTLGGEYAVLPMYVAEITEDHNRGKMAASLNVFWTLGTLLPYTTGPFLDVVTYNIFLASFPLMFFVSFVILAPESPYFLVGVNRDDEAQRSLMKLRDITDDKAKKEIENIKYIISNEEKGTVLDLVKTASLSKTLAISMVLIMVQQMTGYKAFLAYLEFIFSSTGSNIPGEISSIIFGLMLFLSSFIAPLVADKLGRKFLLITSFTGLTISLLTMGIFFYLLNHTAIDTKAFDWLPLLCMAFFTIFYNMSTIVWTVIAELFPNNVRAPASSIASSFCALVGFVLSKCFNDAMDILGIHGLFWIFGFISLFGAIFTFFIVPETKGKSFSEIQDMLKKTRKSI
ncbi:unnamed protein product [Brassicogethes aeneus]|uniref:Major facilitator superfamily (MFS) profile domain-containing protein n=1 Tax=Brassicogethes aeneus TaxID=1431903 RepID=A0A9P0B5I2_BRAAE|nr:unnamed protein product [Brassicogethes aeneus]